MTKSSITCNGYLIQKRSFKNNSLIATFLTDSGQLLNAIIYQGQKKALTLFCPYYLDVYIRDGLSLINKLESNGASKQLTDKALFCALYVNELVGRLAKGLFDGVEVYNAYQNVIIKLSSCTSEEFEKHLRIFEFIFLKHLGYELDFESDQHGEPINSAKLYQLTPGLGFVITSYPINEISIFKGLDILNTDTVNFSDVSSLKLLKIINRIRIDYLLEGKKLQSRELFN
jgi:DNA repair protein RecO (recombination protein O)